MVETEKLSASLEDYLEAIYMTVTKKGVTRAKDIAGRLGVAGSSVTNALHALTKRKLVNHTPYDLVSLTPKGRKIARKVARKHQVLTDFFVNVLAVDQTLGEDCACKMEHIVPDKVFQRLIEYLDFEERCHGKGTTWVEGRGFVCQPQVRDKELHDTPLSPSKPRGKISAVSHE